MSTNVLQSRNYVQNAAGIWTPVGFGAGNAYVPVQNVDASASGSITATDSVVGAPAGAGALLSGASTANSYVALALAGGGSDSVVQLTGTFGGGTVYFEQSADSTDGLNGNWTDNNMRQTGVVNTILSNGTTVAGYFRGNLGGAKYLRARMVGATAPNVAVVLRSSTGVGTTFLNASLPAGSNNIGSINSRDGAGAALTSQTAGTKQALDVNLAASAGGATIVSATVTATAAASLTGTGNTTGSVVANVGNAGNATIVLFGGTYTSLQFVFEACYDATGTTWFPIDGARTDGSTVDITPHFLSAATRAWNVIAPGYSFIRVRVTAIAQTVAPTFAITQGPFLYDPSPSVTLVDGNKRTYVCSLNNTAVASPVTQFSPLWEIYNPVASARIMRVTRITFAVTLATAGPLPTLIWNKISSQSTGGTSAVQTPKGLDSADTTPVANAALYTVAPTVVGSTLAQVVQRRGYGVATVMTAQPNYYDMYFGNRPAKALIIYPGEGLQLYGGNPSAFATAPTLMGDIEWTEEAA